MDLMNKDWIMRKGTRAGKVKQVILNEQEPWLTQTPKIRLEIDPYAPLYPGFELQVLNGEKVQVLFGYIKISRFCIKCGLIGHLVYFCRKSELEISERFEDQLARGEQIEGRFISENPKANLHIQANKASAMKIHKRWAGLTEVEFSPHKWADSSPDGIKSMSLDTLSGSNNQLSIDSLKAPCPSMKHAGSIRLARRMVLR